MTGREIRGVGRIAAIPAAMLTALLAAACETTGAGAGTSRAKPAASAADGSGRGPVLGAIADPALDPGGCGMILWTLEGDRPSPVMRYVNGKPAQIVVDGAPVEFELIDGAGLSDFGVSERQVFQAEDGAVLTVSTPFGLGFDGGAYLERGLLTYQAASGWRAVAPVAGLAGCRP